MSTRQPTHITTDPPTYLVLTTALSSDMGAVAKLVKELLREYDSEAGTKSPDTDRPHSVSSMPLKKLAAVSGL